jgi:hypothetical protein
LASATSARNVPSPTAGNTTVRTDSSAGGVEDRLVNDVVGAVAATHGLEAVDPQVGEQHQLPAAQPATTSETKCLPR